MAAAEEHCASGAVSTAVAGTHIRKISGGLAPPAPEKEVENAVRQIRGVTGRRVPVPPPKVEEWSMPAARPPRIN